MFLKRAFIGVVLSLSGTSFSEVLPAEVKQLYNVFIDDAKRLSPLPGMVYSAGGILENTLELTPLSPARSVVSQHLFHRTSPSTFKQTISKTSFGGHASIKNLGKLAFALHFVQRSKTPREDARKLIETLMFSDEDFLSSYGSNKLSPRFRKTMQKFFGKLLNSLAEDQHDETFKFVTSMVSLLAKNKLDLHDYFIGLNQGRQFFCDNGRLVEDETINQGCTPIFVDDEFLTTKKEEWVKDSFSLDDLVGTYNDIEDYELAVYVMLIEMQGSWVAPFLTSQEWVGLPSGTRFPDCGEVAILNLIRILFGIEKTKKIDVQALQELPNLSKDVEQFFLTTVTTTTGTLDFSDLFDLRSQEARDAWGNVTSSLECGCDSSLQYLKETNTDSCEIGPGFSNINNFVKALLGHEIKELIQLVAEKNKSPIKVFESINQDTGFGTLRFETQDRGNFLWLFEEKHFDLYSLSKEHITRETVNFVFNRAQELGYPYVELISLIPVNGTVKLEKLFAGKSESFLRTFVKLKNSKDVVAYAANLTSLTFRPPQGLIATSLFEREQDIDALAYMFAQLFKRIDNVNDRSAFFSKYFSTESLSRFRKENPEQFMRRANELFKRFLVHLQANKMKPSEILDYAQFVVSMQQSFGVATPGSTRKARIEEFLSSLPNTVFLAPLGPNNETVLHILIKKRNAAPYLKLLVKNLTINEIEAAQDSDGKSALDLAKELKAVAAEEALKAAGK